MRTKSSRSRGAACGGPIPTQFQAHASSAERLWDAALSWYREDPQFERRAVLRSLYLRSLEAGLRLPPDRRWALGSLRRLLKAVRSRSAVIPPAADIWLVVEAPTPSHLGTALAVADLAASEGSSSLLVAADERVHRKAIEHEGVRSVCVDSLAARLPIALRLKAALRGGLAVRSALRTCPTRPAWSARVQLMCEAGLAAITRDALLSLPPSSRPRAVVAPSEYFAVGAGASEAVGLAGLPWVTIQHGAINLTYAPSVADEYWVWSDESATALQGLLGEEGPRLRVVGSLRLDSESRRTAGSVSLPTRRVAGENVIVLFSQSHGLEHAPWVHEALSRELGRILQQIPSARLIIKAHPSEGVSAYEAHLARHARVTAVRGSPGAAALAAEASCCVALDSTALLESMLAGALAVQSGTGNGSIVMQPVAAHVVSLDSLAAFLSGVLTDEGAMDAALAHQRQQLPSLLAYAGQADIAHGEALRELLGRGTTGKTAA